MSIFRRIWRALFGSPTCSGGSHAGPFDDFQFVEVTLVNKERRVIGARLLLAECCLNCGEQTAGFRPLTPDAVDLTDCGFDDFVVGMKAGEKRIVLVGLNEGN